MKYPIYAEHIASGVVVKLTEKSIGTVVAHTKPSHKHLYPLDMFLDEWNFTGRFDEMWREYNPIWC